MTTRHRTTSSSRKDYGLWRPNDGSDSDRPRQTMATTQRHNVDQIGGAEAPRKHRSSRRADPTDPLDPSAAYARHKSSSKDRSSTAHQASYYTVPPSPNPAVQLQSNAAHYDLRAYLKQKTEKRSPRASNEKGLVADEAKPSRSGHRSRHAYPDPVTYNPATATIPSYANPVAQSTRDLASSSRHHRERDKDREKTSSRGPEKVKTRDHTTDKSDDKERQRRKEKDGEKERSSRDKDRHKDKDRRKDRESRTTAGARPTDATSAYQAYAQTATVAQRSADRIPAPYPDIVRPPSTQPQPTAQAPAPAPTGLPWAGLTSAGRGGAVPVPESVYPYVSDKDDPPIPIPPPGRRRTSSKPHRSHHKIASQQAGQDSGLSSSEQEHERPRTTDRHYPNREQASILQRGYSSGPSGSENEKAPTIQTERRKHRTHGESSRHKSKTAGGESQTAAEHTTSQEIANQWYQRHQRDPSGSRKPAPNSADATAQNPSGVPTSAVQVHPPTPSVGLTVSQRVPQIVSIRAGQGPADPHATPPKVIHSGVTPLRQTDPLPQPSYQLGASRQQDGSLQALLAQGHQTAYTEASSGHHHSSINYDASGSNQQSGQSYPHTMHSRGLDHHGGSAMPSSQPVIPDVVVRPPSTRPPSAAPVPLDPYSSRSRSTPAPSAHDADAYRSDVDLPSRFPVYEDVAITRPPGSGAPQHPSASPKRGMTTVHLTASNYPGSGSYDPRSPKPPSVGTMTNDTSRLHAYASGSPAVVPHATSTSSSTPKHAPSVRLHPHRNGSNDTIAQSAPTKPSPISLQPQLHASSRLDASTASRQPNSSSAYPDITRYRSPAPQVQGYPNAYAPHSHNYSTQTPLATAPTLTQATFAAQHTQSRAGQSVDYGLLGTNPLASPAPSAQRIPPRAAPSPAPTMRPSRLNTVSSPSTQVPAPLQSAPPAPTRNQTFPSTGPNHSTATPFPSAHARTISDPQYGGGGGTAYASASLPTRGRKTAAQQQQDILLTPSSLAPSMLPQTSAPFIPLDRSTSKNSVAGKEKDKKRSFFGSLFRSRSSPPKQRDEPPVPPSQQYREKRERNISQPTHPMSYMQTPSATNGDSKPLNGAPPDPSRRVAAATGTMASPTPAPTHQRGYSTSAVPIAQPAPVSLAGRNGNSSGKMFTPFRLLSKRHHTVSTASVEAVDGTVINAMLTGGDSTRSSTAGRPSPPLRDPLQAAQDWRTREEWLQQDRGKLRRRRPGVTFDVGEDVPEDGRPSLQNPKLSRFSNRKAHNRNNLRPTTRIRRIRRTHITRRRRPTQQPSLITMAMVRRSLDRRLHDFFRSSFNLWLMRLCWRPVLGLYSEPDREDVYE
ncbi:hypothetical protein BD309DRAFT_985504 [Dichomitus squalens]|nr:hypothetical protein BD309DRAFT_985504 [Dichomitus squalens]